MCWLLLQSKELKIETSAKFRVTDKLKYGVRLDRVQILECRESNLYDCGDLGYQTQDRFRAKSVLGGVVE